MKENVGLVTEFGTWSYKTKNTNLDRANNQDKFIPQIDITFVPNKKTVDSPEIDFIQVHKWVQGPKMTVTTGDRHRYEFRLTTDGWCVDSASKNGFIGEISGATIGSSPNPFKEAKFTDAPEGNLFDVDSKWSFEVFAVSKKGPQQGKIYGGIAWGADIDDNGKVTSHKVFFINGPTPVFFASVKAYNEQCKLLEAKQTNFPQVPLTLPFK